MQILVFSDNAIYRWKLFIFHPAGTGTVNLKRVRNQENFKPILYFRSRAEVTAPSKLNTLGGSETLVQSATLGHLCRYLVLSLCPVTWNFL